jgi:uncharacterized protein YfbU (UPF0304 family)
VATMSVRVEDDLKTLAEDAAEAQGLSVSEWTRSLMQTHLGLDVPERSAPVSMPKRDRVQLALLHRLLQRSTDNEDEIAYHETRIEVLQHGLTAEYADEFYAFSDELPLSECRLVWDLLDMFTVLQRTAEKIGVDAVRTLDEHAEHALRFRGFDFNDRREGRLGDYADHLIRNGRWTDFAIYFDNEHERGNSHAPVLDSYLRMLDVFRPIWKSLLEGAGRGRYELTEDELRAVVQAWYYPK